MPSTPRLSEREIRSMLGGSGTSSSGPRTSPSGNVTAEDAAYMARIKKAFNDSWRRPTADQRGSRPALVEVRLDAFGHVISANLTQSSGSPGMDATVSSAAKAVRFVPAPPKGFSRRYPALTVEFILE